MPFADDTPASGRPRLRPLLLTNDAFASSSSRGQRLRLPLRLLPLTTPPHPAAPADVRRLGPLVGCSGVCLQPTMTCPAQPDLLPSCFNADGLAGDQNANTGARGIGDPCKGSSEFGTDNDLDNCGGFDVYDRIQCGDADCAGVCLRTALTCPINPNQLPNCDVNVLIGEQCDGGDGVCGTDSDLNNCGGFDVYDRIDCPCDGVCLRVALTCPINPNQLPN
jgi:hypothetical protein